MNPTGSPSSVQQIIANYKASNPQAVAPAANDWYSSLKPAAPAPQQEPGYISSVATDVSRNVNEGAQALADNPANPGLRDEVRTGLKVAKAATGAVAAPIVQAPGFKQLGQAFGWAGEHISDVLMKNPHYSEPMSKLAAFLDQNPEISDAISTANNVAAIRGGVEVAKPVIEVAPALAKTVVDASKNATGAMTDAAGTVKENLAPTPTLDELVGQVAQGSPEDKPSFTRGLQTVDTGKVKTYADLSKTSENKIGQLSKEQDKLLSTDTTPRKVQQLATEVKVGDATTHHNYVLDAVDQLKTYYEKTNDVKNAELMKSYEAKLNPTKGSGLTLKEVNDIARKHGSDLNGYNANGELASGLTKQGAENTRIGLKQTVRKLIDNKDSEVLDKQISDLYTVRDLSKTMAEKVNKLEQRLQRPNVLQKIGGVIGQGLRITGIGDLAGKLLGIDKVPGAQTLNPVELEARLSKNLKRIEAALQKGDAGFTEDMQELLQDPVNHSATQPNNASPRTQKIKANIQKP